MKKKIFFLHNPKAAGTSIIQMFIDNWQESSISPLIANTIFTHAQLNGDYTKFVGYDIYMGHYGKDVFDAVRDGHQAISNFRYPVDRIVSLYNYFRISVNLPFLGVLRTEIDDTCVKAAKSLDFDDFVSLEHPYIRAYTSDYHFRQLTHSPWEFKSSIPIEKAFEFIDSMICYYICEYPDISIQKFRSELGMSTIGNHNVVGTLEESLKVESVHGKTVAKIIEMNRRDLAIYNYAVDRLLKTS